MALRKYGMPVFGRPRTTRIDGAGEWENEIRADFRAERSISLQLQGKGAPPWVLERRKGIARGIYNRSVASDRFPSRSIIGEVQYFLNAMLIHRGFDARQMAFRSNPADVYSWQDGDENLQFAQDTSNSGQLAHLWELRLIEREVALKEIAKSKLRRLLGRNQSFKCTVVTVGASALIYARVIRKSAPRWRGPPVILEIDEPGVTVKF